MSSKHQLASKGGLIARLIVLFFFLAATSSQAQIPRFLDPPFFLMTTYDTDLVVADFNGDGIPDVATCNGYSSSSAAANILLGSADGTFGEVKSFSLGGEGPEAIATEDFNGDGKLDLVIADKGNNFALPLSGGNMVSVLLGNGDGTFQKSREFKAGPLPNSVAVGDFNNDGQPDIVVANDKGSIGSASVLLGNGDGTFAAPIAYTTALQAKSVVARDFNGDGDLDLAVAAYKGDVVSVLLGNGDGTFQEHQDFAAADGPGALVVADFNGDSKLDLAVGSLNESNWSVLLGNGDGTFQAPIDTVTPRSVYDFEADDLDGDGYLDMVLIDGRTTISIFKGNGDGTFRPSRSYGGATVGIAIGDFNHDGRPDLLLGDSRLDEDGLGRYGIAVLAGNGDGTFPTRTELITTGDTPAIGNADLNGDGKLDVVATNYYYNVASVFLNQGGGSFSERVDYPIGSDPEGLAIGDVNNDGKLDLLTANQGDSSITVLLGNGDGTFQSGSTFQTGLPSHGIVLVDLNNDGHQDVATADQSEPGKVSVLLNAGDGTFPTHQELPTAGDWAASIASDDFNADGKRDLAVTYAYGYGQYSLPQFVSIYLSNGDGTFQGRVDYAVGTDYGNLSVATGDINHDSKPDLLLTNSGGTLAIFLGLGDGTFATPVDYPIGGYAQEGVLGDFNGDGNLDVATANDSVYYPDNGRVDLLLGNGDGTFQPYIDYPTGSAYRIVAGDFNGDGALDVLTDNYYTVNLNILFNLGGSRVTLTSSENPSHAGDLVTFIATVRPTVGSALPSGTVEFYDGSNFLGSAILDGKKARFTSSALSVGKHQIKADYLGDAAFVPNHSKRLAQKVTGDN